MLSSGGCILRSVACLHGFYTDVWGDSLLQVRVGKGYVKSLSRLRFHAELCFNLWLACIASHLIL